MSLVKDDGRVIRYHFAELVTANAQVCKKKMMIDDYYVRIFSLCTHSSNEAWLVVGTFLSDARVALGVDAAPETEILGQIGELGTVARLGLA